MDFVVALFIFRGGGAVDDMATACAEANDNPLLPLGQISPETQLEGAKQSASRASLHCRLNNSPKSQNQIC